jgi:hypothetical protein
MLSSLFRVCELRHLDVTHLLDVTELQNSSVTMPAETGLVHWGLP